MARIPSTKGGILICEPSQVGSVMSFSDGTVEAKCEAVPASLGVFPLRGNPNMMFTKAQKNWVLSIIFGIERTPNHPITDEEDTLFRELQSKLFHPIRKVFVEVAISLPTKTNRGTPGTGSASPFGENNGGGQTQTY